MKKKLYLLMAVLLAAITVSLTACGDDKDEPGSDSPIVGYWKISSVTLNGKPVTYTERTHYKFGSDGTGVETTFDLGSDGSSTFKYDSKFFWNLQDNSMTISGEITYNNVTVAMSDNNNLRLTFYNSSDAIYVEDYVRVSKNEYEKLLSDMKK